MAEKKTEGIFKNNVFGEFDSAEELNMAAAGLKEEGDIKNIYVLAKENGIEKEDAEAYIKGEIGDGKTTCEVEGCCKKGQKHHIVFRSQGGLDINLNYKYLCAEHHNMGNRSPHLNREIDLTYKLELQEKYYKIFYWPQYTIGQIAELIGYNKNRLEKRFKSVPSRAGIYIKEDIIRFLMGGKLY